MFVYNIKCINSINGKVVYNDNLPSNINIEEGDREYNTLLLKSEMKSYLNSHVFCSEQKRVTSERYDTMFITLLIKNYK